MSILPIEIQIWLLLGAIVTFVVLICIPTKKGDDNER